MPRKIELRTSAGTVSVRDSSGSSMNGAGDPRVVPTRQHQGLIALSQPAQDGISDPIMAGKSVNTRSPNR
jgi:hypothetical protein